MKKSKAQSTDVWFEDGRTYTSVEGSVMAQSKKVRLFQPYHGPTPFGGRIHDSGKPFDILKRLVWEAYKRVKANRGATGVDNQSIADFDCERDKNLYRTWNLMASGSHFPPPIKAVKISKKSGGTRTLGLPTVGDRIAQAAVEANEQHDRGKAKAPTKKTPTSYGATSANQVWSWDVSYLPTPVRGQFYYLYAILDIHSCKTTGWDVHGCEHGDYAADLVHDAVLSEECPSDSLVLHADNGSIQKGSTLRAKLEFLGVSSSFIRARVSNDNPYTESLFRTCKYRPNYPTNGFESIEAAHEWMMKFVHWYNNVHRHGGIKHVTPAQRHSGEDIVILEKRRAVYEAAKLKNPDRWSAATRNWDHVKQMGLNPEKQSIETVPPEKAVA